MSRIIWNEKLYLVIQGSDIRIIDCMTTESDNYISVMKVHCCKIHFCLQSIKQSSSFTYEDRFKKFGCSTDFNELGLSSRDIGSWRLVKQHLHCWQSRQRCEGKFAIIIFISETTSVSRWTAGSRWPCAASCSVAWFRGPPEVIERISA